MLRYAYIAACLVQIALCWEDRGIMSKTVKKAAIPVTLRSTAILKL